MHKGANCMTITAQRWGEGAKLFRRNILYITENKLLLMETRLL